MTYIEGGQTTVTARHVLDEREIERLRGVLQQGPAPRVMLDLSDVRRCTGLGLWGLSRLQLQVESAGISLRIVGVSPAVARKLAQTGLDGVLSLQEPSTGAAATTHKDGRSARKEGAAASGHGGEMENVQRNVRFYAVRPASTGRDVQPTPYLLFDANELGFDRARRSLRRRATYEDVGFVRLESGAAFTPVAPRWNVLLDAGARLVRVTLDAEELFAVDEDDVPAVWREAAADRGTCHVIAGVGLELERDHPYLAIKHSLELGACYGGVVLVDIALD